MYCHVQRGRGISSEGRAGFATPEELVGWLKTLRFFCQILYATCLSHAVTQLVEALRYKPGGCGFDSGWCHWNFSLT